MSVDRNFQQIWGFRGRDDDIDSSSEDSKSGEANHKLVSVVLPGNDEISDDLDFQKIDKVEPDSVQPRKSRIKKGVTTKARGKKSKTEDATKKEVGNKARGKKRKTENAFKRGVGKKKRKFSALNSALLDEFKIFTESVLQDLKVKREQMFARMKEDMQNLVSDKSSTRQTTKTKHRHKNGQTRNKKSTKSEMGPRNCTGETLERSIVSSRMPDSNKYSSALQERVKCDQAVQTIGSNKKEKGEHVRLWAEPSVYSYNQSDHVASSAYLMLPSAPSEKQLEQQNTDSPFRNCLSKPGVAGNGNGTGLTFDSGNVTINAMNHCGYISGSQVEVPLPSFSQMGSKNRSFSDQHCTQTSSMGNVFQLPLHQKFDNSFNIPSQLPLHQRFDNSFNIPSQEGDLSRGNNILGWRMNGGNITFSGNGNALPGNIAGNMVLNRIHYNANGKIAEYGIQDIRDGNFN